MVRKTIGGLTGMISKARTAVAVGALGLTSLMQGCEGTGGITETQALGMFLGGIAPHSKDPKYGQTADFVGRSLIEADRADRSRSQVNVYSGNNSNGQWHSVQDKINPDGVIYKIYVEHNYLIDNKSGLLFHLWFNTEGLKNEAVRVGIYFWENGVQLKDKDGKFRAPDGNVGIESVVSPAYDRTTYNDFKMFIPYNQLDLSPGRHESIVLKPFLWHQHDGGFTKLRTSIQDANWGCTNNKKPVKRLQGKWNTNHFSLD